MPSDPCATAAGHIDGPDCPPCKAASEAMVASWEPRNRRPRTVAGASVEFLPYGDCMHGPGPNMWSGWNENERLHRACNSCGYKWDEATVPLDQEAR